MKKDMEKKSAYANLAEWFEYLNDDCDYENWSQYLLNKLKKFPLKTGLDVGCGGGWFTRAFQKNGYDMTGADVSAEMLDFAQRKSMETGVRSIYVRGDIAKTKFPKRFDFVTAINDCINYVPKNKLDAAFKNVASSLKSGGIFLFDVSSEKKFQEKLKGVSVDDREEVTYLAFHQGETDGVSIDVTLFVKREDGSYTRLEETHRQYRYTQTEICEALERNGFMLLETEGHLGESAEESDRICFLAQKKGGRP